MSSFLWTGEGKKIFLDLNHNKNISVFFDEKGHVLGLAKWNACRRLQPAPGHFNLLAVLWQLRSQLNPPWMLQTLVDSAEDVWPLVWPFQWKDGTQFERQ